MPVVFENIIAGIGSSGLQARLQVPALLLLGGVEDSVDTYLGRGIPLLPEELPSVTNRPPPR